MPNKETWTKAWEMDADAAAAALEKKNEEARWKGHRN